MAAIAGNVAPVEAVGAYWRQRQIITEVDVCCQHSVDEITKKQTMFTYNEWYCFQIKSKDMLDAT